LCGPALVAGPLWKEWEQSKTIHVFAPGVPLKKLGVSLEDANWNTSVVMVALWVSRIKTVRVVTMRRVVVIRA